jgi:hypothetical protein
MPSMLSDLGLCQLCADLYGDPPIGSWDHLWPTRFGFAGHKRIDGIDYIIRRGSKTPEDWWVDLDFTGVIAPIIGGVHAGFLADVAWTRNCVESVLGPHFVLAGHSLGAGECAIHGAFLTASGRPPLRIVLFGSPRPYYEQARDIIAAHKVPIVSYVNPGDPVPTVPPWTVIWPYQEPTTPTVLGDHADPNDPGFFREHHCPVYVAGLKALEA